MHCSIIKNNVNVRVYLYYRRVKVLCECQQYGDASVEVLAGAHAAHIPVQAAQGQRVPCPTHHITGRLQPDT